MGDGRKASFLRNHDDQKFAQFKVERVLELEERPTHELGTDRPGRGFSSLGGAAMLRPVSAGLQLEELFDAEGSTEQTTVTDRCFDTYCR